MNSVPHSSGFSFSPQAPPRPPSPFKPVINRIRCVPLEAPTLLFGNCKPPPGVEVRTTPRPPFNEAELARILQQPSKSSFQDATGARREQPFRFYRRVDTADAPRTYTGSVEDPALVPSMTPPGASHDGMEDEADPFCSTAPATAFVTGLHSLPEKIQMVHAMSEQHHRELAKGDELQRSHHAHGSNPLKEADTAPSLSSTMQTAEKGSGRLSTGSQKQALASTETPAFTGARRRTSFLGSKIGPDGGIIKRVGSLAVYRKRSMVGRPADMSAEEDHNGPTEGQVFSTGEEVLDDLLHDRALLESAPSALESTVGADDVINSDMPAKRSSLPSLFTAKLPDINNDTGKLSYTNFPGRVSVPEIVNITISLEPPNILAKLTPDLREFLETEEATQIISAYFWSAVVQERRRRSEVNMLRAYKQMEEMFTATRGKGQAAQQHTFSLEAVEAIVFGPSKGRETSVWSLPGQVTDVPTNDSSAKRDFFTEVLDEFYTYLADVNSSVAKDEELFAVLAMNFGAAFRARLDTHREPKKIRPHHPSKGKTNDQHQSPEAHHSPLRVTDQSTGPPGNTVEDNIQQHEVEAHLEFEVSVREGSLMNDSRAAEHAGGNREPQEGPSLACSAHQSEGGKMNERVKGGGENEARDSIFSIFPTVVVHTVYYALVKSFPNENNAHVFSHRFRRNLLREFVYWCTGVSLQHVQTNRWPTPPEEKSIVLDVISDNTNVANGQYTAIKEFRRQLLQSKTMFAEWLRKQDEELEAMSTGAGGPPSALDNSPVLPTIGSPTAGGGGGAVTQLSPSSPKKHSNKHRKQQHSGAPCGPLPTLQAKQWFEQGNARGTLTMERKFEFGFAGITSGVKESTESRNELLLRIGCSMPAIPHATEDREGGHAAPSIPRKVAVAQNSPFLAFYAKRVLRVNLSISESSKAPPPVMLTALSNNDKFSRRLNFKGLADISHNMALEAIAEADEMIAAQRYEDRKHLVEAEQLSKELASKTEYAMQVYHRNLSPRNPQNVFRVVETKKELQSALKDLSRTVVRGSGYELYANALAVQGRAEEVMMTVPGAREVIRGLLIALGKKLRYYERMCTDPLHQEQLLNEALRARRAAGVKEPPVVGQQQHENFSSPHHSKVEDAEGADRPTTSDADLHRREQEVNYGAQLIFEREYQIPRDAILIAEDEEFRSIRSVFTLWYSTLRFGVKGETPPMPRLTRMQDGSLFLSAEDEAFHNKFKRRVELARQEEEETFEAKLTHMMAKYNSMYRTKFLGAILATTVSINSSWARTSKHHIFDVIMKRKSEQDREKALILEKKTDAEENEKILFGKEVELKKWRAKNADIANQQVRRMDKLMRDNDRTVKHRKQRRALSPNTSLRLQRTGGPATTRNDNSAGVDDGDGAGDSFAPDSSWICDVPMTMAEVRAFLKTPASSMSMRRKSTKNLTKLQDRAPEPAAAVGVRSTVQTGFAEAESGGSRGGSRSGRGARGGSGRLGCSGSPNRLLDDFQSLSFTVVEQQKSVFPVKPVPKLKFPLATPSQPLPRNA
jgi:hypothetical protein